VYEPEWENYLMTRANVALNGLEDRVTIFERGLVPPTHHGNLLVISVMVRETNSGTP